MKLNINSFIKHFLFFIFAFTALQVVVIAQPGGEDLPQDPDDPAAIPIDGGASLLAAAGVAYGTKKIIDLRKKKKINEDNN